MRKTNLKNTALSILLAVLMPLLLIGCTAPGDTGSTAAAEPFAAETSAAETSASETSVAESAVLETSATVESDMKVHFLDVGQGLAILVQADGKNLIYDGGDRDTSSFVVSYLREQGVTEIDYLISSHYDSDHLAGLIGCLNAFDVHKVIGSDYQHDSKLYSSFMSTTAEQGLTVEHPAIGSEYAFAGGSFTILSPSAITDDANANSVAIKLVNGNNTFLFTGDAVVSTETDMIASGIPLDCDVLALGHHGSATSSSSEFLQATLPETVVISCGADNQYGHPHQEVMELVESMAPNLYRSDLQGTVIASSDGTKISWDKEPCNDFTPGDPDDPGTVPQGSERTAPETAAAEADTAETPETVLTEAPTEALTEVLTEAPTEALTEAPTAAEAEEWVWKSATGSKYHSYNNCGNMNPAKATEITRAEAEAMGLGRCKNCW